MELKSEQFTRDCSRGSIKDKGIRELGLPNVNTKLQLSVDFKI